MASGGIGTVTMSRVSYLKMMAGVDLVHVAVSRVPARSHDLVGGQMQVMFDTVPTSLGFLKAGKLRPLWSLPRRAWTLRRKYPRL